MPELRKNTFVHVQVTATGIVLSRCQHCNVMVAAAPRPDILAVAEAAHCCELHSRTDLGNRVDLRSVAPGGSNPR
jgi:hypothetical protein